MLSSSDHLPEKLCTLTLGYVQSVRCWSENRDDEDGKQEVVEVLHMKRNDRGQSFKKGVNSYYFKLSERLYVWDGTWAYLGLVLFGSSEDLISIPVEWESKEEAIKNFKLRKDRDFLFSVKGHSMKTRSSKFKLSGVIEDEIIKVINMGIAMVDVFSKAFSKLKGRT
ncbi:hypothetical protein LWI29_029372 [Acer saccharum]|uniref:Uncharacterized protein n=1 Tax=Acer saccharum TaxID=4024 RepID=A0AA39T490_ACESA|nr:hypothetical protein LWI29_029372 [Acer saccharum]